MINCATVEPPVPPPPPSCSDCATKTQPAGGGPPSQSASRMWQSSSGSMRIDTPHTSIITDPAGQRTILLDHLKKEAMVIPMPPASPALPGSPSMPGATPPQAPPMQVHDLGKTLIEGHEVEGKRFTLSPPQALQSPQMPQPPAPPKMPGVQQSLNVPKPPQLPKPPLPKPPQPGVAEVWTSTKLKTLVLTKVTTAAGVQTTYCKPTSTEEPHPSMFQIPPGYKLKSS